MSAEGEAGQPPALAGALFDFGPMMMASAGHFTVGFVGLGKDSAYSRGSGTLIRFGNVAGIVTCAHVLDEILTESEIGILCFPVRADEVQMLKVRLDVTQNVIIKAAAWNELGPDLAFLRLPDPVMVNLERLASVVDGMRHRANVFAGEPDPKLRVELVCGVIDERTRPTTTEGAVAVTPFEALMNVGRVIKIRRAHGMDLFRFQSVPGEGAILPKSYKGTSGGGLWRIYTKQNDNGTRSVVQSRLTGVAFWEEPVDDELQIICHGQLSVYNVLFDAIRRAWP